jgi:DNA-binding transcriptional regulator PaaX
MGRLEKELRAEIRLTKLNSAIIQTLALSGVLAVGLIAPNVLSAMGKLGLINSYQKKQSIQNSFTRLLARGYVTLEGGKVRLTLKGEKIAALLGEGKLAPKKPRKWDGKWRVLIFDIPETRKGVRVHIRATLIRLGFKRLQDSVWIYPYDCEDLIAIFKADLKIGKDLLYLIVDKLEYDAPVRAYFDLVD